MPGRRLGTHPTRGTGTVGVATYCAAVPSDAGEGGPPRRARLAVAALFLANGALFANVVPRHPEIKTGLALSNTLFGTAVAAYGLGALSVGFGGGALVRRFGSARVAPASTVAMAANLVLLSLAPSWATLAAALFVAGALDSTADVANNAHGLRVERRYGRSILNSLHGLWSVGAVVGGLMGTAAAGLGVPVPWHLTVAGLLFAAVAVLAHRHLLPGLTVRRRPRRPGAAL